jgi:hypothetical protein
VSPFVPSRCGSEFALLFQFAERLQDHWQGGMIFAERSCRERVAVVARLIEKAAV